MTTALIIDRSFRSLGTTVRVRVAGRDAAGRAARVEELVRDYDRRLSRFRPDSELCALNADPRPAVPVSLLLADALRAALTAAERTGGLVDPTILPALERAGYRESWDPSRACAQTPSLATTAARPHPDAPWRSIGVRGDVVVRPPGLRLDLGGTGKGHVADLAAALLDGAPSWAIDCGGDLRVGGGGPQRVEIADAPGAVFDVRDGAVATSAIHARAWRRDDGRPAHHLIDPATGEPAFTGLRSVTALAPTTLEAETLAKAALLSGDPHRWLDAGVAVHDDGTTEVIS